jgi:uncharacterized protein YjbJ (UPF0337 family)
MNDWNDVKGRVQAKFSKLSEDSIEAAKGNFELLTTKIQSAYGYAKEQAEKELDSFKDSFSPIKDEAIKTKPASEAEHKSAAKSA